MSKLNKEAIDEITYLLNEVKDVVELMEDFGIHITSDPWTATSFNDSENILVWKRKDFENINENISNGDMFYIGGNIITGGEHQYKNKWIIAPQELAEIQGKIFKNYLQSIMNTISLKHFKLKLNEPYGLIDNCGWEHFISINAIIKQSALEKQNKISTKQSKKTKKYNININKDEVSIINNDTKIFSIDFEDNEELADYLADELKNLVNFMNKQR